MVCITQVEIEVIEALIRVARPAIDRYLVCHPSIRLRIFSTKYWYELAVRRVVKIGVPRQVPIRSVVGSPKIPASCFFMHLGVRGENHTLDLVTLMSWLDDLQNFNNILPRFLQSLAQNFNNILPRFLQSLVVALIKRKISSAKNRCERQTRPLKEIGG